MPTFPLPERANVEQLRKRAKDLQRAVRSQIPKALALVEEHAPHRQDRLARFSLDSAQLVIARMHGFPSWPGLRRHLDAAGRPSGVPAVLTVENRYRLRRHWAAPEDVRRCAAAAASAGESAPMRSPSAVW